MTIINTARIGTSFSGTGKRLDEGRKVMERNHILWKSLVFGIIVLFLGISIIPMVSSLSAEKHSSIIDSVKELKTVTKTGSRDIYVILHGEMGENGWYISPVDIVITADNGTEIERVLYSIDHGGWVEYTEPFIVTAAGSHLLDVRVYDQYGNEWNFSFVIKIDMYLPIIVLQKEKMFLNKIKFIANVSDATSGVWRVEFYLDDELQFTDYDSPFEWVWEGAGNHTVTAKVFDWAGHSASSSMSTPCAQNQSKTCVQQNSQNLQINQLIQNLTLRHQMISQLFLN
jgi:hypothetical protein